MLWRAHSPRLARKRHWLPACISDPAVAKETFIELQLYYSTDAAINFKKSTTGASSKFDTLMSVRDTACVFYC